MWLNEENLIGYFELKVCFPYVIKMYRMYNYFMCYVILKYMRYDINLSLICS